MKKTKLILFSILAGILLSAGWPARGFPFILFFGFVPLLFIEDYIRKNYNAFNKFSLLFYSFPAFLTWNILTTWWIYYATVFGMVGAIVLNALFMSIIFHLFHTTSRIIGEKAGYFSFIFYWIAFEYFHLDWDLSWPWLTLGNGFANHPEWIQWYEYTGVFGGTLWILLLNLFIFFVLKGFASGKKLTEQIPFTIAGILILLVVPLTISIYVYHHYEDKGFPVNVVVVQPNIDPYNEKFDPDTFSGQMDKLISLAKSQMDSTTQLLIYPETAISENVWENDLDKQTSIFRIRKLSSENPKLNIIIGISSLRTCDPSEKKSSAVRKFTDSDNYFEAYNTALLLNFPDKFQLYHKSKLVPGVEEVPFPKLFKPLESLAINLGGTTGSLGTQKDRTPFTTSINHLKVAPVICYESIYGEFLSKYLANGAQLIAIITNDGWWSDTPGYKQHFQYARLRAIETRRCVARSANTGISGFINQKGDVLQTTGWWQPAAIKQTVLANNIITFYTKYGDFIGRLSMYLSVLIILFAVFKRVGLNKNG